MADRIPTFADLCSAIVEGQISATIEGSMYQMNALDIRRYLNKFRSLPTISTSPEQNTASSTDSVNWSASIQTSLA